MTLITAALAPLVIAGGYIKGVLVKKDMKSASERTKEDTYNNSNALLSDILINYKTVIGFGPANIKFLLNKYSKMLDNANSYGIKMAHIGGILQGY